MSNYNYGSGGGYMDASPSMSQGEGKQDRVSSLRPVCVRQLADAGQSFLDHGEAMLDGEKISQMAVVAQVRKVSSQSTNVIMILEDGTGSFEARKWTGVDDDADEAELLRKLGIEENSWVKILGVMKAFQSRVYLSVTQIRTITDPHEIYHSLLDSLVVHLDATRGPPVGNAAGSGAAGSKTSEYVAGGSNMANSSAADQFRDLPKLERRIVNFVLNNSAGEDGIDIGTLSNGVGDAGAEEISNAIESLLEKGHIYNTIDELHYAVSV